MIGSRLPAFAKAARTGNRLVGLDFDVRGGLTTTGEDFAIADIAQGPAVRIVDFSVEKIDPTGSTNSFSAMAMHFHAFPFQKPEELEFLAFVEGEGLRTVVDMDFFWHGHMSGNEFLPQKTQNGSCL